MTVYGAATNTYYFISDFLGTVHAVCDSAGAVVESYRYDAWGRLLEVRDGSGNLSCEADGRWRSGIGNRFLFHGREYSWKANLYLNSARWYDPITGRFISKDPSGISNGLNEYEFCANNPVNFIDPTGEGAVDAAQYWANVAADGYNAHSVGGWFKTQGGNAMGMFINMWHAQEMEEHAGLAGQYWDECRGKAVLHAGAVVGYAALDYVQFTGLNKLGKELEKARAIAKFGASVTQLAENDVVVGMIREGRILKSALYGDNPMIAPSHEVLAKQAGVFAGKGVLRQGAEAFTVVKQGGEILIRGSANFNATVSAGAKALLKSVFR